MNLKVFLSLTLLFLSLHSSFSLSSTRLRPRRGCRHRVRGFLRKGHESNSFPTRHNRRRKSSYVRRHQKKERVVRRERHRINSIRVGGIRNLSIRGSKDFSYQKLSFFYRKGWSQEKLLKQCLNEIRNFSEVECEELLRDIAQRYSLKRNKQQDSHSLEDSALERNKNSASNLH